MNIMSNKLKKYLKNPDDVNKLIILQKNSTNLKILLFKKKKKKVETNFAVT